MQTIQRHTPEYTVIYLILAYLISLFARYYGVFHVPLPPHSYWNGIPILTTQDGFYYASLVQHYLEGTLGNNPRLTEWYEHALTFITVTIVSLTPLNAETVQYYLPIYAASAIVIPIFLISRLYMGAFASFWSAVLGSITLSYYNRTVVGYYDTDMFAVTWPLMIIYFLLVSLQRSTPPLYMSLAAAISLAVYPFFYTAGGFLALAIGVLIIVYRLISAPKAVETHQVALMILSALLPLGIMVKFVLLLVMFWLFHTWRDNLSLRHLATGTLIVGIALIATSDIVAAIWGKILSYTTRGLENADLHFLKVQVIETSLSGPGTIATRISGSIYLAAFAAAGYILLIIRHRHFVLTLPLVGLGVFAFWGGVRFTIYAVPAAAIAFFFLADHAAQRYIKPFSLRFTFLATCAALALYPNLMHIQTYKITPVLTAFEALALDQLKKRSSPEDYIITWWDYGYPVWYYANKNTLVDGGKHHRDNFIVSEIFSTVSQREAAQLSRLAQYTYQRSDYSVVANHLFYDVKHQPIEVRPFLKTLESKQPLPPKQGELYLYLPLQMLKIFSNVQKYSRLDLNTGEFLPAAFFFKTKQTGSDNDLVSFAGGINLIKSKGVLEVDAGLIPVKYVFTTDYDADGILHSEKQVINEEGALNIIRMIDENMVLILDDDSLNSTFIQLMVLENYDPELFELVEKNMFAKIYRVKI